MKTRSISKLIGAMESIAIEWKPSLSQVNEIIESVAAFANAEGGSIFIGISKNGKPIGISIGRNTIEDLANRMAQHTEPKMHPRITVINIRDKEIIAINVKESHEKPVLANGKPYIRVGKSNRRMSREEYEVFILAKHKEKLQFDNQTCKGAILKDIDWGFVKREFIPLYERVTEKKVSGASKSILRSLGCLNDNKPSNAGILLFGKDPQKFFMNAYIALARYGTEGEDTKRLDYKEFTGNLFQQIDNCNTYIREHIDVMSRLKPGEVRREDIPEYGWFSIRELITNAVCHRDYWNFGTKVIIKMFSNRIEFYNPGGVSKGITLKGIAKLQFSRNPVMARVLAKVEYIEELGEGWNKILKEHKAHPLKPILPTVETDSNIFLVNIYSTKDKFAIEQKPAKSITGEGLNERQRKALEYLRTKGSITRAVYCDINKIGITYAKKELSYLIRNRIIKRAGKGKKTQYFLVAEQ